LAEIREAAGDEGYIYESVECEEEEEREREKKRAPRGREGGKELSLFTDLLGAFLWLLVSVLDGRRSSCCSRGYGGRVTVGKVGIRRRVHG